MLESADDGSIVVYSHAAALIIVVSVLLLVSSLLSILVICTHAALQDQIGYYLLSLSVGDLLMATTIGK
jgi:hypothetical protein